MTRVVRTILFTDIVGSTQLATKLGDQRWRSLLDRHDETARRLVAQTGGRLVKQTGDGLLAVFESPGDGVRCAEALRRELASAGVPLRAGLHAGEVDLRGSDVGGVGVHIAARVMDAAGSGEIPVSRTIRELTTGSELAFAERGERDLRGIGRWQLFAVVSPDPVTVAEPGSGHGPGDLPIGHHLPWRVIAVWAAVAALSFLWGSAVLGIALTLSDRGERAWWVVVLLGPIPIVALIVATGRFLRRASYGTAVGAARSEIVSTGSTDPLRPAVPDVQSGADITDREREVLGLLATGRTQTEIARELFVAPGTVKAHVNNIYRKLGARNRTEALARARELGLIS